MNSIKQAATLHCEYCQISYRVWHNFDEPYYCDECGELLYRPSIVKEHVFQQMLKASNGMNLK